MSQTLTYRYVAADLKLSLKQAFPDSEISSESIIFWIRTIENFIRQRSLKVQMTGSFLSEYYGVNAVIVNTDTIKKWITLPNGIYDLDYEKGIDYISYNQTGTDWGKQTRFTQTFADRTDRLYYNPYEAPSPSNPYFYRVNNNIFLLGIESVAVVNVNIGIYGTLDPRPVLLPIDTPLGINDEQYPALREMVLNMGRFVMIVPSNRTEQGDDERQGNAKELSKNTEKTQNQQ